MRAMTMFGLGIALAIPAMANAAQTFVLDYTTFVDATSGPAVTVNATITTDDKNSYDNGYYVTGMSGTRGGEAISFDGDPFSEVYFPGNPDGDFVDSFGVSFQAGGKTYNFYKNGAGDFAYHEFDGSTGRIVYGNTVSLRMADATAPVPEPATWAMMIGGFGAIGGAARYRRRKSSVVFGHAAGR